jgi:hypothetical protein
MEPTNSPNHVAVSEQEKERRISATPSMPDEKTDVLVQTATAEPDKQHPSLKASTTREDGTEYPTGLKLALIALALCLSVFLVALGMFSLSFNF